VGALGELLGKEIAESWEGGLSHPAKLPT